MKKRLLCLLSVITVVAILIPGGTALAFDSKIMNRISYEYAHVNWIDNIDIDPDGPGPELPDGIFDRFAIINLDVNKTDEGTNVYFNVTVYDTPYFNQTPGNQWPPPMGREWGNTFTTEDVFSLVGKKVLTGATLSSVTIPLQNNFDPPRPIRTVTLQTDWTALGTLYTSSTRGQYTSGDTTTKYSEATENIQATPSGTLTFNPPPPIAPPSRPIPAYANGNIGTYERTETIMNR